MITRKTLSLLVSKFIADLEQSGYSPFRVILFGSYANGRPNEQSDIVLTVWDKKFTGCSTSDIEPIASIVSKYPHFELHPFSPDDVEETNPFVTEILRKGIVVR